MIGITMKTCGKCGLTKERKSFSQRSGVCGVCMANKYVTCSDPGCRRKGQEEGFGIYIGPPIDKYFCRQLCCDRAFGLVRDRAGFVKIYK